MSRIFYAIAVFIIILVGILFAVLNSEPVKLNYYFGFRETPLSLALMLFLFLGAILGVLASLGLILRSRREVARLRKMAEVAEKEISNLRAIPIKNQH
jgi:putative membrane protein